MAYKGKEIFNPKVKMGIRFLLTSADTNGELLEMESTYHSGSLPPPAHFHPHQEEDFTVLEGEISVKMDGELKILKAGDTLHVPKGKVHAMWNSSSGITRLNWKVRPPMQTEFLLETLHGLAADGRTDEKGVPGILQISLTATRFFPEFRMPSPPLVLQKIIFSILRPFALLSGHQATYDKYLN